MLPCQQVSGMWNLDSVQPVALRGSLGLCLLLIGFHQSSFRDWTMTCSLPLPPLPFPSPPLHHSEEQPSSSSSRCQASVRVQASLGVIDFWPTCVFRNDQLDNRAPMESTDATEGLFERDLWLQTFHPVLYLAKAGCRVPQLSEGIDQRRKEG
ncbi:RING finger protein 214 [Dissostichus eleginoides]|uniref:RING finger protein 214 n=1 Tax=Dissostichus eleginoides TaxID=100907 RepID=A0AAD9CNZ4_DISEL|nr:RING finger protein 214 [Dissostichus eleginoides]